MFEVLWGFGRDMHMWVDMKELLIAADSCNEEELGRPVVQFCCCKHIPSSPSTLANAAAAVDAPDFFSSLCITFLRPSGANDTMKENLQGLS